MTKISSQSNELKNIQENIRAQKNSFSSYEDAAQAFISSFYHNFKDSVVLARVFLTVPFNRLPENNKLFVESLGRQHKITDIINDDTLILSLVGTAGKEHQWNDRMYSKGHVGKPLLLYIILYQPWL